MELLFYFAFNLVLIKQRDEVRSGLQSGQAKLGQAEVMRDSEITTQELVSHFLMHPRQDICIVQSLPLHFVTGRYPHLRWQLPLGMQSVDSPTRTSHAMEAKRQSTFRSNRFFFIVSNSESIPTTSDDSRCKGSVHHGRISTPQSQFHSHPQTAT